MKKLSYAIEIKTFDQTGPGTPNANNVQAYTRKYQYDKMGNVLQVKQQDNNGFTRKFGYFTDVNTLEKISDISDALVEDFTYDSCGNQLTAGDNRNYVWNAANQLISYYNQAGSANPTVYAQYDYDSSGNRVSKVVRTGTVVSPIYERTVYIDGIFEYHIRENGTTVEKNYVHVMDDKNRIAMVRIGNAFPDDIADEVTYILEDQIGSSTSRLNTTGAEIDKEEYFPFGDASLRTFSKKRYQYCGKEKDSESGLYYYGARYYAPWTCRFISVDPAKEQRAWLTPYNYVQNNPINLTDPDGALDDGGGDPVKKGDTFVGDDGKTYTASIDEVEVTAIKPRDEYEQAILDSNISFTANYGWVDNTHAFTDTERNEPYIGVEALWNQLKNEPSPDQIYMGYYSVNYKQDIVVDNLSIGIERQYLVKPGLSLDERKSVALAIFQDVSRAFEQMQGLHPTSGSSFEPADLPSNMLSFYRVVEGMERSEIEEMTNPVSPEQALEVYRSYPGTFTDSKYKNKSFNPRYFDTPYTSNNFGVPDRLNTISPASISSTRDFGKANLILFDQDFIRKR